MFSLAPASRVGRRRGRDWPEVGIPMTARVGNGPSSPVTRVGSRQSIHKMTGMLWV